MNKSLDPQSQAIPSIQTNKYFYQACDCLGRGVLLLVNCEIEIGKHNKLIDWMIFDKDLEDKPIDDELPFIEIKNQISTAFTSGRFTPSLNNFTPLPTFAASHSAWTHFETSLDQEIYRHNANLLRRAIVTFLKHCLARPVQEESVFQDGNIFCFEAEDSGNAQEGLLQGLVDRNLQLTPWRKKQMTEVFDQYGDLTGVFRQLRELCGRSISQELVCLLAEVLEHKLSRLEKLEADDMDGLLPRMERFWGDENDERAIKGGWNVYNDVDYDSVRRVATADIEQLSSTLYFSKRLRHLTLGSVDSDSIAEVNLLDKFTSLVAFLAEGLLLSMEGISQREEQLQAFALDLNYTTAVDGAVEGHSSKKIKGDDL